MQSHQGTKHAAVQQKPLAQKPQQQQQQIDHLITPKEDPFVKVRPEVSAQIIEFLDFHTFLVFRLVNKRSNIIIKQLFPQRSLLIQQQLVQLENTFKVEKGGLLKKLESEQLQFQEYQTIEYLHEIGKQDMTSLQRLANPNQIVQDIIHGLLILSDPKYREGQDIWKQCLQQLKDPEFLRHLIDIDMDTITERQITRLNYIQKLDTEQAKKASRAAGLLCQYLKATIQKRTSSYYLTKQKIKNTEQKINQMKNQVEKLKKLGKV